MTQCGPCSRSRFAAIACAFALCLGDLSGHEATAAPGPVAPTVKKNEPTDHPLHTLQAHDLGVRSVIFSPDGRLLATTGFDDLVRFWSVTTGKMLLTIPQPEQASCIAFSPDGQTLVAGGSDGLLRLWDVHNGRLKGSFRGSVATIQDMAFSNDGSMLATLVTEISIWHYKTFRRRSKSEKLISIFSMCIEFSPDGKTLAVGGWGDSGEGDSGEIVLWQHLTNEKNKLQDQASAVKTVAFSPDGKTLASGTVDGVIVLWDVDTGEATAIFSSDTMVAKHVRSVAFSPDGSILASGSGDDAIRLWEVESGNVKCILKDQGFYCRAVFSPDGTVLASSGGKLVKIWKVADLLDQTVD